MARTQFVLGLFLLAPLSAQGLLVGPPTGPEAQPPSRGGVGGVSIVRTAVHADVVDGVATTTIDQVFHNGGTRDAEGTWFLPMPAGAVADGFTMTVGGKEIAGEVLDANRARSVYESIVRQRRDPGLLEYAGEGLLRARIFPIPANGDVGVTVRLRQVLQPTGGIYEWTWPLRAARHGDAVPGVVGVDVRIRSTTALATILTPYANAEIRRSGECEATVTMEGSVDRFDDLRVLYGLAEQEFGLHVLPYRRPGEPGWFTMLLSPPRSLTAAKLQPRCVQFVVDTSGSMAGAKIEQAKAAVKAFLRSLRPEDVFQVVTFASAVQTFFEKPLPATSANVDAALRKVDTLTALGGTNISGALQQALEAAMPSGDDGAVFLPQIVFVTDGQPTMGVTDPGQILDLTKRVDARSTRVFALGVGDEIDVRLIDDLVQQHRGTRDFVRNQEKIEAKVDALCQKISQPALTDVEVRCDGLDSFDVHPTSTRDLFCGEMMQVVGRYRSSGQQTVRVRGKQAGVDREFVFVVDFPKAAEQNTFVQTLWARQHVASLLDAIRRSGAKPELVDEVRRLATQYGIVTPYTSQLIVEESERLAGGRDRGFVGGPSALAPSADPAAGKVAGGRGSAKDLALLGRARTGAEAVEESVAATAQDFGGSWSRDSLGKDREIVRRAAGRVFVVVGDELVEQGLPADWQKQAVEIEAFSDGYFAMLKANPSLRDVLALGERIVFRDGTRIVRCKPAAPAPVVK
ncbi:MAG: VWA domain-containing protein [Planctomycetes bacterium]|nr:VWA domain-containing protein [Planctomycetota bacterium]